MNPSGPMLTFVIFIYFFISVSISLLVVCLGFLYLFNYLFLDDFCILQFFVTVKYFYLVSCTIISLEYISVSGICSLKSIYLLILRKAEDYLSKMP